MLRLVPCTRVEGREGLLERETCLVVVDWRGP